MRPIEISRQLALLAEGNYTDRLSAVFKRGTGQTGEDEALLSALYRDGFEFLGEIGQRLLDGHAFETGCTNETDGIRSFVDESRVGRSRDRSPVRKINHVVAHRLGRINDRLGRLGRVVQGHRGVGHADGTAHRAADMRDDRIRAGELTDVLQVQQERDDGAMSRWFLRGSYHDQFERRDGNWIIVNRYCHTPDDEGEFLAEGVKTFAAIGWTEAAKVRAA